IAKKYDEQEAQSVVQDKAGNYFVYILEYNQKVYRGGSERVLCYDKTGKLLWDKLIGQFSEVNNPIVSYLKRTDDGRIYMRGHIKLKTGAKAMFWEGWINSKGIMTQKNGEEIDWKKDDWKKRFSPED
ncbi:MAG TPA: hypothetical protein VK177_14730, partial [Flavobacteriales bacterium]|nr:hypothetical protein [Flavobacteriales bacterium]